MSVTRQNIQHGVGEVFLSPRQPRLELGVRSNAAERTSAKQFVAAVPDGAPCPRCARSQTVLVCPTMWPIAIVAVCCFDCGRVRDYKAAEMILTPLEAARMYKNRGFVTKRGISRDVDVNTCAASDLETLVQLILMGRDAGLSEREIADSVGVTPHYVDNILQLVGANAECLTPAPVEVDPFTEKSLERRKPIAIAADDVNRLTPREGETLELIRQGLRNADIAEKLQVSVSTVKQHVGRLLRKLNATNRYQLGRFQ
jgi:DNA-binding CsgD family transcriptional regulator